MAATEDVVVQSSLRMGDTVLLYAKEKAGFVFSELSRCVGLGFGKRVATSLLLLTLLSRICSVPSTTRWRYVQRKA